MAHPSQQNFCSRMKQQFPKNFLNKKVLDIGSLDINGNNRFLFENCNYIGLDVGEGHNVDIVAVGHLYDAPNEYFDTIISTEVFEHDMFYEETIKNIMRMLKPGGAFIFTCASTGRPEHGTVKSGGSWAAPLLTQISEEWSNYYKNLTEDDVKKISGFTNEFSDGIFEYNSVDGDLYFFGIKGGIKNNKRFECDDIIPIINESEYSEDIFVVDTWPDTENKENDLIECIKRLKQFKPIPILLVSHYPIKPQIQAMVDYYLFDKDNPLLHSNEYNIYEVSSGLWAQNSNHKLSTQNLFQHDYAIWTMMQKAFKFCDMLGKKIIHFMEYDNIVDTFQYKQAFLEKSKNYDAVLYEYHEHSSSSKQLAEYIATYIFSIKTDIALKTVNEIQSKWDYFHNKPSGFQLERTFLRELKKHTSNIYISPYIANNDELNTQAVWNRDGVLRDDAAFQIYLGVDEFDSLYLCLISGFFDFKPAEDYLIEYRYGNKNEFLKLHQSEYKFVDIGKYKKGQTVCVNYNGIGVFNQFLGNEIEEFRKNNTITTINQQLKSTKIQENKIEPNSVNFSFIDGAKVEILGNFNENYFVNFLDTDNNDISYSTTLKNNTWAKTDKVYFVNWKILVTDSIGNETIHNFDPTNKRIFISFESFSLGDTIAWIPYVEEFRKKWDCHVIVSTPLKDLFESKYPKVEFILPGNSVQNIYAQYRLGLFVDNGVYNIHKNKSLPNTIPLQKVATEILGLEYKEIKPKIKDMTPYVSEKPYITIAMHSTAQAKYWNNPTGWQEVVDYVKELGYDVYLLSKEEDGYMGNKIPNGVIHIQNKSLEEVGEILLGSKLFIGVSSGLSWYAWGLNIPTILISGFTDEDLEPKADVIRVINKDVCNGCWGRHQFDKGDWNWCPEHKGTERHFECSKTITSSMVIPNIKKILKNK
jgi:autotransporter strand-loop-strand O-heptosyltransferase